MAVPVATRGLTSLVTLAFGVDRRPLTSCEELAAIDLVPRQLELVDRRVDRRELLIREHDDRHLVALGPVERREGVLIALPKIARCDDDVREVALRRMERELKVALLLPRGHPSRGTAALVHHEHRTRRLGDRREADALDHEREPRAARRRRGTHAHVRGADGHVDRADLVLALHDEQLVVALLAFEKHALVRRRRDRVIRLERTAGLQLRDRVDLVSLCEDARLLFGVRLERVGECLRVEVIAHVLERELGGAHVQLADLGALSLELGTDDLGDKIERVVA